MAAIFVGRLANDSRIERAIDKDYICQSRSFFIIGKPGPAGHKFFPYPVRNGGFAIMACSEAQIMPLSKVLLRRIELTPIFISAVGINDDRGISSTNTNGWRALNCRRHGPCPDRL